MTLVSLLIGLVDFLTTPQTLLPGLLLLWNRLEISQVPSAPPAEAWHVTAPFIFDSVQGFLRKWPNSYAPNGHSIVAETLAPGTVLCHAKRSAGPPNKPTFFAFDAYMCPDSTCLPSFIRCFN